MKSRSAGLAAGALSVLALASPAAAAPVTVDLRIEGPTRTLFEGPVTTDVRTFRFTDDPAEYRCDGTEANQGESPTPVPTRGAVVAEASERTPFTTSGEFFASLGSPAFDEIAGESVAYDPGTNRFLGEYKNEAFASAGSCADPVAPGDRVLFAYGTGEERLLALDAPATARPGETVELTVSDASSREPVTGAEVGGQRTGADGRARVTVAERGPNAFKATRDGAIRSNRRVVCVTDGQDGFCGTSRPGEPAQPGPSGQPGQPGGGSPAPGRDTSRPVGRVAGIAEKATFARRRAPRELRFSAADAGTGVAQVKLRLRRRQDGDCAYFSGRKERFVRAKCGRAFFFKASDRAEFSYLLPEALAPGRYVLDVIAIDRAGNRDALARGRSRIVFTVR